MIKYEYYIEYLLQNYSLCNINQNKVVVKWVYGSSGSLGFQKRLLARNGGLSISYECSFTCIFSRPQYTLYILYDIENKSTVAEGSPMAWTGAVEDGDVKPNKTCRKNEK